MCAPSWLRACLSCPACDTVWGTAVCVGPGLPGGWRCAWGEQFRSLQSLSVSTVPGPLQARSRGPSGLPGPSPSVTEGHLGFRGGPEPGRMSDRKPVLHRDSGHTPSALRVGLCGTPQTATPVTSAAHADSELKDHVFPRPSAWRQITGLRGRAHTKMINAWPRWRGPGHPLQPLPSTRCCPRCPPRPRPRGQPLCMRHLVSVLLLVLRSEKPQLRGDDH